VKRGNLKKIKPILKEVKETLQQVYKDRLKGIILYGSYARGDATEESDIDLIVLLDNVKDANKEIGKCFKSISEIELRYDTLISIISFRTVDFRIRRLPIILNAKREGINVL